ncbi:MAG: hypothetical protein US57_C0002G0023 [Candidatus Moranbacteria bacterium GW2011_GWC2_37_73]|nr:MAG: hypothetical protein UR95_C0002G0121 [Parcubacteria group bacterium GW2011_GWC1_36_108]KKQ01036.1 MAG: hypothetical protein US09_C0003G0036 [Candidatus Moranbacteria bacterium GW2011_GWD1_36_198]KKQ02438.1 MAG: hypothetical protein US10_C0001G0036 [Candidatus Moranbacteria bacterium GW2011_GWD2_36_198]KKQ40316.1 MAG: hypothetical protein US57_C0002G0023 [Candidatus Moranbacteria bacterium GW2011_GWC2_37_73]HAS00283.1 hypothetical protein [Candidatus Moranbacteria bacterium]
MKNFLHKQREIIAILAYVAVVVGIIYFAIFPLLGRISNINDEIQQEAMKQESVKLHIEQLPKIQKQYEALQASGDLMDVLLNKDKAVVLIERLEKLADSTGNEITIAVQQDTAPIKKTQTKTATTAAVEDTLVANLPSTDYLEMKISLNGSYNSIIEFIDLLEKFEYYADIIEIKINKEEANASTANSATVGMFSRSSSVASKQSETPLKKGELAASLGVVFYTN